MLESRLGRIVATWIVGVERSEEKTLLVLIKVVLGVELFVCTCHGGQWPKKED